MQVEAGSSRCKNLAMWSLWTLYIILAVAVSIGRGDGPKGQGLASVRVEALLAKMTLEDKVGSQGVLCVSDCLLVTTSDSLAC